MFPEQLNGAPFTVPRDTNLRSWLYRIRPSVSHSAFEPMELAFGGEQRFGEPEIDLVGWYPRPIPATETDFVHGLETLVAAGDPTAGPGVAVHSFAATTPMNDTAFYNGDGDLMVLPDVGSMRLRTEFGWLEVGVGQLAVIPRGVVFSVFPGEGGVVGFAAEIFNRHFVLPQRGVIGANGLADERHFEVPTASYEDRNVDQGYALVTKFGGRLYRAQRPSSPFDVVAWHGRYVPYRYDLARFNAMGTITWDHPDPSIFTVLTSALHHPGENLLDLVVFPNQRWDVAEHTFRPPYFHRNAATEFNFIVGGTRVADQVFTGGGSFLTPPFTAHGTSGRTVERHLLASDEEANAPRRQRSPEIWLQFESALPVSLTRGAKLSPRFAPNFRGFAQTDLRYFDPTRRDPFGNPEDG